MQKLDNILKWVGGIMPSFTALFFVYKEKGYAGIRELISKVFKLRLGCWYFPIFLIIPVCLILAHSINILFGNSFPNTPILKEPWMIPPLLFLFIVMVASEEFGWRGLALEQLQKRWNALTSSIILGSIWAIWHIPMFLSTGFGHHDSDLPFSQFFITLVLVSILITWVQNNTRSLAPAFILHALINLSGEVLPLVNKGPENQGNYTQWIITNLLLTIVVIGVVRYWGARTLTRAK